MTTSSTGTCTGPPISVGRCSSAVASSASSTSAMTGVTTSAQGEPQEPAHLHSWPLLYGLQWKSSRQQKTHRCKRRPAGRERSPRHGSKSERSEQRRSSDPAHRWQRREHGTEPDRRAGTKETNQEQRTRWRRRWERPEAGRRRQHGNRNDSTRRNRPRRTRGRTHGRIDQRAEIDDGTTSRLEGEADHKDRRSRRCPPRSGGASAGIHNAAHGSHAAGCR